MTQMELIPPRFEHSSKWRAPVSFPSLRGVQWIALDTETTGLHKQKDKPVGIAGRTEDGRKFYLPWGHRGGGNLDEAACKRWAKKELVGKDILALNAGFDAEQILNWGVDLEQQGCRMHEVAHRAALLNEHRYSGFSLDALAKEYCGRGKIGQDLDKSKIALMPAAMVGPYAEEDADLVWDIHEKTLPLVKKEELERVLELEDSLIWCVNHMERNAARLDVKKLHTWRAKIADELERAMIQLSRKVGFRINPDSNPDMRKLFAHLSIPIPRAYDEDEKEMVETFAAQFLKPIKVDEVQLAMRIRQLKSVKSKYLDKYLHALDGDIIRFKLHQLRGDDYGTITGRFSAASPDVPRGFNPQQVFKVEKQLKEGLCPDYIIRELFIPDDGYNWFSSDASQIEFRLFVHYSGSKRLIQLYNENPDVDFHQVVADMIGQERYQAKHNNFGKLYGMGLKKLTARLGLPCTCGCDDRLIYDRENHASGCPMVRAIEIIEQYDEEFPEAKRLLNKAADVAKHRGYVKTYLGRRRRYPDGKALHSAFNAVIQGSAADINKLKLREVYNERQTLGIHKLRLTVHDEMDGDQEKDPRYVKLLRECLDEQCVPLKVPIIWDTEVGDNWRLGETL